MDSIFENKIVKQIVSGINIILMRRLRFVISLLVISIFALGFFFLIGPKYKSIISGKKEAGTPEELKFEERLKYLNELKKTKESFKTISAEDIKRIRAMAPPRLYHEELLAQLEKIVLENGFLVNSISIEEEKSGNISFGRGEETAVKPEDSLEVKKVKISMSVDGADYNGLKNLLNIIENNLRLIDIEKVTANTENKTVSIEAYAYYVE